MAEPTNTLQTLRRNIANELLMPFARRFKNGYLTVGAGSTISEIFDTELTQKTGFWNGSWFYDVDLQELSKIRAFNKSDQTFQLEVPVSESPVGDLFEIHTIWNALDIHRAINRAIDSVKRIYVDTVTDQSLVYQEDTLEYSLSSLSTTPWVINKVWIEYKTSRQGTVQSATGTTIEVESSSVTADVNTNWYVSIYDGTGKGQLRAVSSASGTTVNVAAWDTNPDGTSKYCLWDATEQLVPWRPLEGFTVDSKEWPTILYFNNRMPTYYGMRIRLEYIAYPQSLSAESDTSIVPAEYILNKACSLLYGQRLKDNKVDRETYYAESERYKELADIYLVRNLPQKPDTSLKSPRQSEYFIENDALGWDD